MGYLLLVSTIWAFSFGLIKGHLTGLNPDFVAFVRMAIALPLFLPFLQWRSLRPKLALQLTLIGAVQYGLMYSLYLEAFQFLGAYEIALFTIFTPLYVVFIHNAWQRKFQPFALFMAFLAVLGAGVIRYQTTPNHVLAGFLLMQASNFCFALGQVAYRKFRPMFSHLRDREVYALLYLGAVLVTALATTFNDGWSSLNVLTFPQLGVLLYLGILASGLCFFWWNKGATLAQPATLAVMNNVKIPLAVLVSLVFFGEQTDLPRLLLGGGIMLAAVLLAENFAGNFAKRR